MCCTTQSLRIVWAADWLRQLIDVVCENEIDEVEWWTAVSFHSPPIRRFPILEHNSHLFDKRPIVVVLGMQYKRVYDVVSDRSMSLPLSLMMSMHVYVSQSMLEEWYWYQVNDWNIDELMNVYEYPTHWSYIVHRLEVEGYENNASTVSTWRRTNASNMRQYELIPWCWLVMIGMYYTCRIFRLSNK